MTSVEKALSGFGKIIASFRETPAVAKAETIKILQESEEAGIGNALVIEKAGQLLLEIPVAMERVGLVICAGLNPIAALEEANIKTESRALASLVDYRRLQSIESLPE